MRAFSLISKTNWKLTNNSVLYMKSIEKLQPEAALLLGLPLPKIHEFFMLNNDPIPPSYSPSTSHVLPISIKYQKLFH